MIEDIRPISVMLDETIRQAIAKIDAGGVGIVLVVDKEDRLLGTITDGDVRRAMLSGLGLDTTINNILVSKTNSLYKDPICAPLGTCRETLLQMMRERAVRQIPLLDIKGSVVALITAEELLPSVGLPLQAVIMAGGLGTRLRPLTENLPKPMLPIGDRPLMERIVEQLKKVGIKQVNVTTHFKPEKIKKHFGDGRAFGVELNYVNEDQPLGTGGALGLLSPPQQTQIVINGDILTQVNIDDMLVFHQDNRAEMTVAVRRYEMEVPYGVVECQGARVICLREKPQVGFLVNAGIYLLEPSVYEFIPTGKSFNMTDLIQWLLDAGRRVISFPLREYWMDIGEHADYLRAQDDMKNGRIDR